MAKQSNCNRRGFLKQLGRSSAALGLASAFPSIVPSHVLGADAPSNKVIIGIIGLGWRGLQLMSEAVHNENIRIAAISDIDRRFLINALNILDDEYDIKREYVKDNMPIPLPKGAVDGYHEYERLLERKDIDAIMFAIPDHWHAKIALDTLDAGKDVYGEKPLALTINQGRKMVRRTRETGRIYQVGSQQRSDSNFRIACEYVRSGRIGKISKVTVRLGGAPQREPVPDEPIPAELDWDRWLGSAKYVPYNPLRCHIEFRWFFEYSGGMLTDWGAHHLDIAQWGLGTDGTGPISVEGTAEVSPGYYNTFTSYEFKFTYASGVIVHVVNKNENGYGVTFHGEKGEIACDRGRHESWPKDILEKPLTSKDVHLYKSDNHLQNWIDCIKSRELPITDVEIGHRSVTMGHIANICGRLKRKLDWDPKNEMFVNDSEANQWLSRAEEMRGPWAVI